MKETGSLPATVHALNRSSMSHAPRRTRPAGLPGAPQVLGVVAGPRVAQTFIRQVSCAFEQAQTSITVRHIGPQASFQQDTSLVDVVLVRLEEGSLVPLEWAISVHPSLGSPQLVFVTGAADPAAISLHSVLRAPVISTDDVTTRLPLVVPLLFEISRGLRATLELSELVGEGYSVRPQESGHGLFAAEQRFREAYVTALLARTRSRKQAAELARVPYRTFCHIVNSLR